MLLCHTGLALSSSVAGFGVSLPSVSFLLRSSLVVFIFSLFVVSGLLAGSLCVLFRIRACTCSVNFMLNFVSCLLDSNFIFRFVVVHSSQVHLVWLYDHHLRRVLVASNRPPFVLIRSYICSRSSASSTPPAHAPWPLHLQMPRPVASKPRADVDVDGATPDAHFSGVEATCRCRRGWRDPGCPCRCGREWCNSGCPCQWRRNRPAPLPV